MTESNVVTALSKHGRTHTDANLSVSNTPDKSESSSILTKANVGGRKAKDT